MRMKIKATAAATLMILLVLAGLLQGASSPASAAGTAYYVSDVGDDGNDGISPASAWKSLGKVNGTVLEPGDSVSFRRGDTWTGGLIVNQSGTPRSAITMGSYGSGNPPSILSGESGSCVRVNGSFVTVDGLRAEGCGYAGISVYGDYGVVKNSTATYNAAGIRVGNGSDFGKYTNNILTDNNIMNVNTPGTGCGTPDSVNCTDDSGAFGALINGDDNEFSGNTFTGSTATSYDFGHDGSAIEIYNGNRNRIHHNVAVDNNVFSEIGRSNRTADGNTFSYNLIRASCGATCAQTTGLIVRGPASSFGPTNGTVFEHNTVWLDGSESQAVVCHASCPRSTVIRGNILVAVRNSIWMDGTGWAEGQNVLNGPTNIVPSSTSTTAPAQFVDAPADLHLSATSPAIDRAGDGFSGLDLGGQAAAQNGDCTGTGAADSGAYEYDPPDC
ncbi:right-handed parallel beta-helix repeat-containing protein [Arthrobacter sp. UYCu712]|uniref:right-handed parallel beta-helix repeat-containing protein n=1 Tax=Arthrobacter sp. UYCu712 TaxID=3156340 RepID=UPI00339A60F9